MTPMHLRPTRALWRAWLATLAVALAACAHDSLSPLSSRGPNSPRFSSGQKTGQCFLQLGVAATQLSPQAGGTTTISAPSGSIVTRVAIKAGTSCYFTPEGATGTYPIPAGGAPCYLVTELGTATVTVTRVGSGSACKDISTIEYVTAPAPTTGALVICKLMSATEPPPEQETALLSFTFDVGGQSVTVDENSCSSPIELAAGQVVVTEYDITPEPETGTLLQSVTSDPIGAVSNVDYGARTATVSIVAGGRTKVWFTNSLITGINPEPTS